MSHMLKNESHIEFAQSISKLATRASGMSDGERLSKGLHDSREKVQKWKYFPVVGQRVSSVKCITQCEVCDTVSSGSHFLCVTGCFSLSAVISRISGIRSSVVSISMFPHSSPSTPSFTAHSRRDYSPATITTITITNLPHPSMVLQHFPRPPFTRSVTDYRLNAAQQQQQLVVILITVAGILFAI